MTHTPEHYDMEIQPIEVMEKTFTPEEFRGFLKGNILKYVMRYQSKGGVDDLRKIEDYLDRLVEFEERHTTQAGTHSIMNLGE